MGLHIIAIKLKKPPERDIKEVISFHIKPQVWEHCGRILDQFVRNPGLKIISKYLLLRYHYILFSFVKRKSWVNSKKLFILLFQLSVSLVKKSMNLNKFFKKGLMIYGQNLEIAAIV
mgnify:FL=1